MTQKNISFIIKPTNYNLEKQIVTQQNGFSHDFTYELHRAY